MELVDSHGHILDKCFENDLNDVVKRAKENGVNKIICSAYNLFSSKRAVELSHQFAEVYSTVGWHPENVLDDDFENSFDKFANLAKDEKCVAIGEIGLDYHFTAETKDLQKLIFDRQISFANELNLPVVVHSRDAMGDTIEILQNNTPKRESLLHCYGGSIESAKILIKLGFSFSFGGVVTFKNAKNVVEVVRQLPVEKILLETDCPYMTPAPFRGQRNEPKNVVYVADAIARIKGMTIEEVAKITTENAKRVFGI